MSMWQDNTLHRVSRLEDQIQAQSKMIEQLAELVGELSALVMLQTVTENSIHELRGPERL